MSRDNIIWRSSGEEMTQDSGIERLYLICVGSISGVGVDWWDIVEFFSAVVVKPLFYVLQLRIEL